MKVLSVALFLLLCEIRSAGAMVAAQCKSLDQETTDEIIGLPCKELMPATAYKFTVKNVDKSAWDPFAAGLGKIEVDVLIEGSSLTSLKFSSLQQLQCEELTIKDNQFLTEIEIRPVSIAFMVKKLVITGNPKLTSIKIFSEDGYKLGNVEISNNAELNTLEINIKAGQVFEIANNFVIEKNPKLADLHLENIDKLTSKGKLVISNNPSLKKIELPKLENLQVANGIFIKKNVKMTSLNLGSLTTYVVSQLEVTGNTQLKMVLVTGITDGKGVKVRGNPLLEASAIVSLKKMPGANVQEEGECIFDEAITDLSVLDICKRVLGDLTLAIGANGTTKAQLIGVNGSVFLATVPHSQFGNFLNGATITGQLHSDDCSFTKPYQIASAAEPIVPECPATTTPTTTESAKDLKGSQNGTELTLKGQPANSFMFYALSGLLGFADAALFLTIVIAIALWLLATKALKEVEASASDGGKKKKKGGKKKKNGKDSNSEKSSLMSSVMTSVMGSVKDDSQLESSLSVDTAISPILSPKEASPPPPSEGTFYPKNTKEISLWPPFGHFERLIPKKPDGEPDWEKLPDGPPCTPEGVPLNTWRLVSDAELDAEEAAQEQNRVARRKERERVTKIAAEAKAKRQVEKQKLVKAAIIKEEAKMKRKNEEKARVRKKKKQLMKRKKTLLWLIVGLVATFLIVTIAFVTVIGHRHFGFTFWDSLTIRK